MISAFTCATAMITEISIELKTTLNTRCYRLEVPIKIAFPGYHLCLIIPADSTSEVILFELNTQVYPAGIFVSSDDGSEAFVKLTRQAYPQNLQEWK